MHNSQSFLLEWFLFSSLRRRWLFTDSLLASSSRRELANPELIRVIIFLPALMCGLSYRVTFIFPLKSLLVTCYFLFLYGFVTSSSYHTFCFIVDNFEEQFFVLNIALLDAIFVIACLLCILHNKLLIVYRP